MFFLGKLRFARGTPRVEHGFQAFERRGFRLCLLAPRFQQLRHLRRALFHRLKIGETQLRLDDVDIAQRIDSPLHMRDVRTLKAAHHMRDRIHLTNVLKELIAKPLALRRALHEPRNIDKTHARRRRFLGMIEIRQHRQTRIRHRHHADVRLDRAERIVRRFRARLRNRVEQRALAHIRQTDNTDLKIAHRDSFFHRIYFKVHYFNEYACYVIPKNAENVNRCTILFVLMNTYRYKSCI